jgi:hypothetical protein
MAVSPARVDVASGSSRAGDPGLISHGGAPISVRRAVAHPMQFNMPMPTRSYGTTVRRRADGLVQIQALPAPISISALRSFGLGLVGVAVLLAALLATPFFVALGARGGGQGPGRGGAPQLIPPR